MIYEFTEDEVRTLPVDGLGGMMSFEGTFPVKASKFEDQSGWSCSKSG